MASYSGDPTRNQRDALRFRLDDTDPGNPHFEDGELDALLAAQGDAGGAAPGNVLAPSVLRAALEALAILESRFALQPTKVTIGKTSFDYSDGLRVLGERRTALAALLGGRGWYAGGISAADKAAAERDLDRVRPAFRRGLHDFPGAEGSDRIE